MIRTIKMVSCMLIALILAFGAARATSADAPVPVVQPTLQEIAAQFAQQYGVSYHVLSCIITHESQWNPNAIGDKGLAKNVAQFHLDTFERFEKQEGETLNYDSAYDQIKLIAFALSEGQQDQWTTWKKYCE